MLEKIRYEVLSKMDHQVKILIADENNEQRKFIKDALIRAGYRSIDEASNGEEALSIITRNHHDIVIADIWLSKLDGIGLVREAKRINYSPDKSPEFIIVSLVANQNIFIEASKAGAALCLPKPIDQKSLCEHIENIVKSRNEGTYSLQTQPSFRILKLR